jgi:LCP family protein required for cell wall assembly
MLLLGGILGATYATARVLEFLNHFSGGANLAMLSNAAGIGEAAPGTIPYRLKHADSTPINILLMGYGGAENDAPYLTDTMMAVRLDPASHRVAMISIPRDLYVPIDFSGGRAPVKEKLNSAFEFGTDESRTIDPSLKRPEYRGRDGGGRLAEDTVSRVTGLHFDRYAAVDFKAFRDVVNAVSGVDVCLDGALDDYQYPDYHNGYIVGGIHYRPGCQHVDGEHALQLARSRHAIQPDQASDFGRARRQQQLLAGIKKQALSVNGVTKAPALMSALEKNFKTDLSVGDLAAIYEWSRKVDEKTSVLHYALTDQNLLRAETGGGCGAPGGVYTLCPDDPSYQMIHAWVTATFPPAAVLASRAPVRIAWGGNPPYLADGVTDLIKPYGFQVSDPLRPRVSRPTSVIYDFSGGQYPATSTWLSDFFSAPLVTPTTATPAPGYIQPNQGFVVYLGHDYGVRWFNLAR